MRTRFSMHFSAYWVSPEQRGWWDLTHIHERVLRIIVKYLRTFGFLGIEIEWRGRMLNRIYTFDCLVKCSFLIFKVRSRNGQKASITPTFVMSSTITTSNLSPYPSDLKYSIIKFPFSSVRTVPRTAKPLSKRVRTIHMPIYPLAPETRTLDPLSTVGIVFE